MASGVSVKMGVSGVAQFKQGMKESQQAVKTLDEALKLNEAQLKINGNEELVLQNKTKILTEQIEKQSQVVKQGQQALELMRKNGVSETSTEFQKMQQNVYKASTDLLNMRASLEGIGEAGEEAQEGVSEMNQSLQRIGAHADYDSVISGIGKITDGLEAAAQKAVQLGKKLVQAMLTGGQWADDLQTTADKWEMTPEQVYRMQQTANIIDTDAETIFQARQKLIQAMGKGDNKETMGAFAALGISNLTGSDANIENVFWKAGQSLMNMQDKVQRNEYAMKLYGKSWTELIPIFKAGRQTYEETMASWTWVGDEQFENLTKLNDEEQKLTSEWEAFQLQFESALAPTMTSVMETLEGLLHEFNTYLQSEDGQKMLKSLGEAVSGLFEDLATIDPQEVVNNLTNVFTKITEGLEWLIEHRGEVVEAMKYIVMGWAALKLTGGALQILNLINGARGLTGMGGKGGTGGTGGGGDMITGGKGTDVSTTGSFLAGSAVARGLGTAALTIAQADPTGSLGLLVPVLGDKTTFGRTLRDGGDMGEALSNSWETIKASAEQGVKNFSDYFTNDLPNAFWSMFGVKDSGDLVDKVEDLGGEIEKTTESWQRGLFGGEGYQYEASEADMFRREFQLAKQSQEGIPPAIDRMTEVAAENQTVITAATASNDKMTAAAEAMSALPAEMQTALVNAIITGMNGVTITINQSGIDAIGRRIFTGAYQSFGKP